MLTTGLRRVLGAAIAVALLAGCQPPRREIRDAWIRLPAVPGRPAAAYFRIKGGPEPTVLHAVTTPAAQRSEMHESMNGGMRPIETLVVGSGERIAFAPGGRHVMLYGVDPRTPPGKTIRLRFDFSTDGESEVDAIVVRAADPAPNFP